MDEEFSQDEAQVVADSTADEQVETQETQVEEQKEDKRPSSVVKLLKQRNELKKEVENLRATTSETEKLAKKIAEMEELIARQTLEQEAKEEKIAFFIKNPVAKEFEADIDRMTKDKGLSYDEAFKLYAADNNPALLMDEQYRNKATSTNPLTWITKDQTKNIENPESIKDFETLEDFGKWSDKMGKDSRKASGYSN